MNYLKKYAFSKTKSMNTGLLLYNGATVTTADVEATNGVVHIVDKVILPPNVSL